MYILVPYLLRSDGLYKIVQSNLYWVPWYNYFRIEKSCDAPNLLNDRDLADNEPEFEIIRTISKVNIPGLSNSVKQVRLRGVSLLPNQMRKYCRPAVRYSVANCLFQVTSTKCYYQHTRNRFSYRKIHSVQFIRLLNAGFNLRFCRFLVRTRI